MHEKTALSASQSQAILLETLRIVKQVKHVSKSIEQTRSYQTLYNDKVSVRQLKTNGEVKMSEFAEASEMPNHLPLI